MDGINRDAAIHKLILLGVPEPDAINVCSMLEAVAEILHDKGLGVALMRTEQYAAAEVADAMVEAEAVRKVGLIQ